MTNLIRECDGICHGVTGLTRAANAASAARSRMLARLYSEDTLHQRLSQDLEDMAPELRQLMQEQDAMVRQGQLPRQGPLAAADHAHIGDGVVGARKGRVVTTAMRPRVRPATRSIRVVSRASAKRIAGRRVVRRRASLDFPDPGAEELEIMDTMPA